MSLGLLYNCTGIDDSNSSDCFTSPKDCSICNQPVEFERYMLFVIHSLLNVDDCEKQNFNDDCNWYTYDMTFKYLRIAHQEPGNGYFKNAWLF